MAWKSPRKSSATHYHRGWKIVNREISSMFPHVKRGRAWFLFAPTGEYEGHFPTVEDAKDMVR